MNRKTSAMVGAGLLAAIAVFLAFVILYVPVLGMFATFIWALPIIISGCRYGLKWSILTLVVASALIAILMTPVNALFLGGVFGVFGLVLGECLHRDVTPTKIMTYGTLAAVLALVINFSLALLVVGVDPIKMTMESFQNAQTQAPELYRQLGFMTEEQIQSSLQSYQEMMKQLQIVIYGGMVVFAAILVYVNYLLAKKILNRIGMTFKPFPAFTTWIVPEWILWPFCASLLGVTYCSSMGHMDSLLYKVCTNLQFICMLALELQGMIVIYWYVREKNKPSWWASAAWVTLFIPITQFIVMYLGAFDIIMDFRKIRPASRFRRNK